MLYMKNVQMSLDENLIAEVDALAAKLGTTRSGLTRDALRATVARLKEQEMEKRHRAGYRRKPVKKGEFSIPENEHAWGKP
jgi:metal-responsive CopG/Arc/MetJ family transcriptional regulator